MALSVVDLYKKVLPRTNCGDCGHPTCLAFASRAVADKLPLKTCPYIEKDVLAWAQEEMDAQHAAGKWTRRDMAEDALIWAKARAASMKVEDLAARIGGRMIERRGEKALELPYFRGRILIGPGAAETPDGAPLTRWEQVFIYNHLAQGGRRTPTGKWKGFQEFPNTVSKVKSMKSHVEAPLIETFRGKPRSLREAGAAVGGAVVTDGDVQADVILRFQPLPRVPVMLLFRDAEPEEGYDAEVKLLFDETVVEHLDIESIMFLSERIKELLCEKGDVTPGK